MPKPKIVSLPFDSSWVDFNEPAGALHKRLKRYEDPWYAHFRRIGAAKKLVSRFGRARRPDSTDR